MNYEDAVAIRARRDRIAARDLIERGLHELRAAERGHVVAERLDSKPVECPSRLFIGMRELLVELTIEFGTCLLCFGNPLLDVRCHLTGAHRAGLHRALQALDGGYALLLGVTEDHIHSFALRDGDGSLAVWERKGEEPTLVVLPRQVRYWTGEEFAYAPKLAAVDVPQAAVSARLTMPLTFDGVINYSPAQWEQVYAIEGVRDGSCFLFQLAYQGEPDGTTLEELAEQYWLRNSPSHLTEAVQQNQIPYTLEFFDAGGQVLLTQTNP